MKFAGAFLSAGLLFTAWCVLASCQRYGLAGLLECQPAGSNSGSIANSTPRWPEPVVSPMPSNHCCDGADLTKVDLANLERSWITPELARQAALRRVTSIQGAQIVSRNGAGDYAGLLFPYFWPGEHHAREYRLRRDHPDLEYDQDGEPKEKAKYLSPPRRGNLLYFVPGTDPAWLQHSYLPIAITEGEKKTLALWRLGHHEALFPSFLPVGLPGVWNFRGTIGK